MLWTARHTSLLKEYLSLHRNKKQIDKTMCYDWSSFTNRDISNRYMVTERNKFNTHQEISETYTLNDEYENFVSAYMEEAAECIPTKSRAECRVPWESLVVWKKRGNMKIASLVNKRNPTNTNAQKPREN